MINDLPRVESESTTWGLISVVGFETHACQIMQNQRSLITNQQGFVLAGVGLQNPRN